MDTINAFAAAHPYYFAAIFGIGGFFAKAFIFTVDNAKLVVRKAFDRQRAALLKLGKTEAEVQAIMEDEAALLIAAATEAKTEADDEGKTPPPAPTAQAPQTTQPPAPKAN